MASSSRSSNDDPYAIPNLIPAGVLEIILDALNPPCSPDPGALWHRFDSLLLIQKLDNPEDEQLCRGLEFLINHRFISAFLRILPRRAIIRVYLIPFDLAGVQGQLRVRKDDICSLAARYLKQLLPRLMQDKALWDGEASDLPPSGANVFKRVHDDRTLSEIYGDIASPRPTPWPGCHPLVHRLLSFDDDLDDVGMRSTLHTYQRRSVAALLQKELDERDIPDPVFVTLTGIDGTVFYLQPAKMEFLRERPSISSTRGGILCEELGTGKTVMILALVTMTLNQLSTPEPSILDPNRPILTPLSFRHFPSAECRAARQRARIPRGDEKLPSLVELLLHRARVHPSKQEAFQEKLEATRLSHLYQANTPFYHHFEQPLVDLDRSKRNRSQSGPAVMFITAATLIVVPDNLISQWSREIDKHCALELRVLIVRTTEKLPSARSLANDYDIILMPYKKLSDEARRIDITKRHSWQMCTCPEFPDARVPQCICKDDASISPLLRVRWKRLVIDEGHASGDTRNNLTAISKLLSVERKWVVTGTPTTHLLGLNFGNSSDGSTTVDSQDIPSSPDTDCTQSSPESTPTTRIWTKDDAQDLTRLDNMMTSFLAVPIFQSDPKRFKKYVSKALLDPDGPPLGAIQVLIQVMEMVMIRHRIEDVEEDVVLPPLNQEVVLLDLDPYALKSYNALQALVAINAVDSEREDQDYLFHPRNKDALALLMRNISEALFYRIDDRLSIIDEVVHSRDEYMEKAYERKVSSADLMLLQNALNHVQIAASDPAWRSIQSNEDTPYRIYDMDRDIFKAWTRIPNPEKWEDPSATVGLLHCDMLLRMHDIISERPLTPKPALVEQGEAIRKPNSLSRQAISAKPASKGKWFGDGNSDDSTKQSRLAKAMSIPNHNKVEEVRRELQAALTRQEAFECEEHAGMEPAHETNTETNTSINADTSSLLSSSVIADVRVGSSVSSKLNFILDQVQKSSREEKFLVFSKSPLSLAHIAEGLDLIRVKHLHFGSQTEPRMREEFVMTFETSETYRVFLMDLKHAARGLNLISASRIIFCEPVWRADVESQAIKRAHRIGQTRPITVQTLAIRGTYEETMLSRRNTLQVKQDKIPIDMTNETGMRQFIANPQFLEATQPIPTMNIPLIYVPSPSSLSDEATPVNVTATDQEVVNRPSMSSAGHEIMAVDRTFDGIDVTSPQDVRPVKKRRVVCFV